ncbi:MAG: hypothetical protein ACK46X_11620 [Candidatus Sericytochromatia bacterium]
MRMIGTAGLLALALVMGPVAPAWAQDSPDETAYPPAVVEEEPLFFDVTVGPQLAVLVPLGVGGAVPLIGFEATRYVAWPAYMGAAAYAGPQFGPAGTGYLAYGGAKAGVLVRIAWYSLEPGVLVGAIHGTGSAGAADTGPLVLPDLTAHLDLSERFTLRVGAGYLFSTAVAGLSGPVAKVGMTF